MKQPLRIAAFLASAVLVVAAVLLFRKYNNATRQA